MRNASPIVQPSSGAAVIALIEDDPIMGQSMVDWFAVEGLRTQWFRDGAEALAAFASEVPDLVVCDIRLPDMSGEDLHRRVAEIAAIPFVFVTGFGDIAQAVRLMKAGAADYVTKPFEIEVLLRRIATLLAQRSLATAGYELGRDAAIVAINRQLSRVAPLDSTVLLTGPSGSGKEIAARALHARGPRHDSPFVAINCAAIPGELLESEIFGHERGAFTGAVQRHVGIAEAAGTGTLFLDEVCDLPAPLQAKLLRLLQERSFKRVGGERPVAFRARVVAATNADIRARVASGAFREDLFYRLAVIAIEMPPLKARPADILPLSARFLEEFAAKLGAGPKRFTTLAEDALSSHDFPGNIRELRNRIERAVALSEGEWIAPSDLFPEQVGRHAPAAPVPLLADARDSAERRAIVAALEATGRDVTAAAARLGISRSTLFEKIRRLGVRPASI